MCSDIRIIYMGTPDFAVEPLKAIVEAGYDVVGVVTVPDKPAGRGQKLQPSPVKSYAVEKGLKLMQPEKLKSQEFVNELISLKPDILVVVAFRMLPESVWSVPKLGTFNLHASLLPQYRGAAPINWAIINGEKKTGVTTFLIDHEIDTGKILFKEEVEIGENETAGELHDRLMIVGSTLVVKTIKAIADRSVEPTSQHGISPNELLKPAPKIFRETCRINWNDTTSNIHNHIRGLSPYPAAWTEITLSDDTTVQAKILRSTRIDKNHDLAFGTIQIGGKNIMNIACCNGFIGIQEIQVAGKRPMKINELLNGYRETIPVKAV